MDKKKVYFWVFVLIIAIILLIISLTRGITGNSVYKIYSINDFPGIYVDFGPTQSEGSTKWGSAAVGNLGEYWNAPLIEDSEYTFFPLRYANGDISNMKIQLNHLDKNNQIRTNLKDEMFNSYAYSSNLNNVPSIALSNLIVGSYDVYLYGNSDESNVNYELYKYSSKNSSISTFLGLKSTYANSNVSLKENWIENVHYIVYKDVDISFGDYLEIVIKSRDNLGNRVAPFISGMQIVRAGTNLAYNVSFENNKYNCYDSDDGVNYTFFGKIYVNGMYSSQDTCDNENIYLNELYCKDNLKSIDIHKCENGCVDGICITDFRFNECNGCLYDQICLSKGLVVGNKYCDFDKFLKIQKNEGENCLNNFECTTLSCLNSVCESIDELAKRKLGIKYDAIKLICRISHTSSREYEKCLDDSFRPLVNDDKIIVEDKNKNNKSEFDDIIVQNYSSNPLPETSF